MATAPSAPRVSVEEYIERFAEGGEKPICEYIDGELIPKPLATKEHSRVQGNLVRLLFSDRYDPLPELTTRLKPNEFLVPDIAVEDRTNPIKGRYPGPGEPVVLCIEIKSPPDRIGKLFGKCEDYHKWGVPHCWIFDPDYKVAWEYTPEDLEPRKVQDTITAGPIQLSLADVFRGL